MDLIVNWQKNVIFFIVGNKSLEVQGRSMDDPDFVEEFHRTFWNDEIPEADSTPDSMDPYINMELAIDQGEDQPSFGRVVKHMKDTSSGPIEQAPSNPMLDTQLYKV